MPQQRAVSFARNASRGAPPDYSRRVFRGRAGPTDGNLPRFPSKPRPRHQAQPKTTDSEGKEGGSAEVGYVLEDGLVSAPEASAPGAASGLSDDDGAVAAESAGARVEEDAEGNLVIPSSEKTKGATAEEEALIAAYLREVRHLRTRIGNVRESMQLSVGMANPSTWETNCLNAVRNAVSEWRSIVLYHAKALDLDERTDRTTREAALDAFGLVQMGMQCGPLTGSNPGYFKRCGGDAVRLALEFLRSIADDDEGDGGEDLERTLRFTPSQTKAIEKWMGNASKAAVKNDPPSKSASKLQSQKSKKEMKRLRRSGKK